jgi:hypothetical protein
MEKSRKISVRGFLGIAIRGLGWRCQPASIGFVLLTAPQESSPALISPAAALPGAST